MITHYNIRRLTNLIFASAFIIQAGPINAQPQENDKVTRFEFGMFPDHCTVAHTFWFSAPPRDTLRLIDVKTGCGCLRAEQNRNLVASGDSLPVTLLWTPPSQSDTSQMAYLFFAGNPDPIRLNLAVGAASPDTMLSVTPPVVEFPTARAAQRASAGVRVTNKTTHSLDLKIVSTSSDKFTVVMPDKVKDGEMLSAQIGLTEPDDTARFERSFTIEATEASGKKSFRVTVPVRLGAPITPVTEMKK